MKKLFKQINIVILVENGGKKCRVIFATREWLMGSPKNEGGLHLIRAVVESRHNGTFFLFLPLDLPVARVAPFFYKLSWCFYHFYYYFSSIFNGDSQWEYITELVADSLFFLVSHNQLFVCGIITTNLGIERKKMTVNFESKNTERVLKKINKKNWDLSFG